MTRGIFLITSIVCLLALGIAGQATQVWNAVSDWSSVNNGAPNNVWSYGWSANLDAGYVFGLDEVSSVAGAPYVGLEVWYHSDAQAPMVIVNKAGNKLSVFESRTLGLSPGPGGTPSILRWTAPSDGVYDINASFWDAQWSLVNVYVLRNGVSVWDAVMNHSNRGPLTFSSPLSLAAGDTIDFACCDNVYHTNSNDTAGLTATITSVAASDGTVTGVLTTSLAGNAVIPDATVQTIDGSVTTTSGPAGVYTISLPAGDHALRVTHPFTKPKDVNVHVTSGQVTALDIQANPRDGLTYYVNGSTGNDSYTGTTPAAAWKTIARGDAQSKLIGGDTVVVAAGAYVQPDWKGLYINNCSGNPISGQIAYKAQGSVLINQSSTSPRADGLLCGVLVTTNYTTIDGFEVTGSSWGIVTNDFARNNTIANCKIHRIRNNIDPASGIVSLALGIVNSASTNNVNHHNLIYDIGDPAAPNARIGIASPQSANTVIDNNTIVGAQYGLYSWSGGSSGHLVRNNIIANSAVAAIASNSYEATPGFVHSHNLFYNNNRDFEWNAAYGTMEFQSDPEFADAPNDNYTLASASPAINTGVDVGLSFIGSAPDIGCYETASTLVPSFIQGTARTTVGERLPITKVRLVDSLGRPVGITVGDGTYLSPIVPDTYTITASRAGFASSTKTVTVSAAQTKTLDFDLSPVPGNTFYVSDQDGDDSYDGRSPATPWKTISRGDVTGQLGPGDTVIVASGTYAQENAGGVRISRCSGEPGSPTKYVADPTNGPVIISQNYASFGSTDAYYGILVDANNIVLDGFEISGGQWGVYLNSGSRDNTVSGCRIHDMLEPQPGAGNVTSQCAGVYVSSGTRNLLHHNRIYNIGYTDATDDLTACILAVDCADLKVYNNTLVFSGTGVHAAGGSGHVVKNNIIAFDQVCGLSCDTPNELIHSYNLFSSNTLDYSAGVLPGPVELNTDPFLDAGYGLQTGSPAINLGVDVGLPFGGPAPDIGADESDAQTPSSFGIVKGVVSARPDSTPVRGALVQANDQLCYTDASGYYALALAPGTYSLDASATGYIPAIETVTVAVGTPLTKNIKLRKTAVRVWDAVLDYSNTVNGLPGNDWSYGHTSGTTLEGGYGLLRYNSSSDLSLSGYPGLYAWSMAGTESEACVVANLAHEQRSAWSPRSLGLSPGTQGDYSIIRWTAPRDGAYTVNASFFWNTSSMPTSMDVYVLQSGVPLWSEFASGYVVEPIGFNGPLQLSAGETIDFAGGFGFNNSDCDGVCLTATITGPDGTVVVADCLADLKSLPDDKLVTISSDMVVTAASGTFADGGCYVQGIDRINGIKVVLGAGVPALTLGDKIQFSGTMSTDANGERCVVITSVTFAPDRTPAGALGMGNKVVEMSKTGLLVRVWGHVVSKNADYLTLDDGNGAGVKIALNGLVHPITKTIGDEATVAVTGLVSQVDDGVSETVVVRPRANADISTY